MRDWPLPLLGRHRSPRLPGPIRFAGVLALACAALVAGSARAGHTNFDYRVEGFLVTGQVAFGDTFEDGILAPWNPGVGTASEIAGELSLRSPGLDMPDFWDFVATPSAPGLDVSNVQLSGFPVSSGSGDFVASAGWTTLPSVPAGSIGGFYALSITAVAPPLPGECNHPPFGGPAPLAARTFAVAMRDFAIVPAPYVGPPGLAMGLNQQVVCIHDPLDPSQNRSDSHAPEAAAVAVPVTGNIVLRLSWDDTAGEMTALYSVDGGSSFLTPFAARAHSFTNASFQLLGDPVTPPAVPVMSSVPGALLAACVLGIPLWALRRRGSRTA